MHFNVIPVKIMEDLYFCNLGFQLRLHLCNPVIFVLFIVLVGADDQITFLINILKSSK